MASRRYLREKWDKAKYDMEKFLDIYEEHTEEDWITDETLKRCNGELIDNLNSVIKEVGGAIIE